MQENRFRGVAQQPAVSLQVHCYLNSPAVNFLARRQLLWTSMSRKRVPKMTMKGMRGTSIPMVRIIFK